MTHPYIHAKSSAKKYGGIPEDYLEIHKWFDESKESYCDARHRAVRHHAEGIFEAESVFGNIVVNSDGKEIPVRYIGEQHVKEDCHGLIPSRKDWLSKITAEPWMNWTYSEEKA